MKPRKASARKSIHSILWPAPCQSTMRVRTPHIASLALCYSFGSTNMTKLISFVAVSLLLVGCGTQSTMSGPSSLTDGPNGIRTVKAVNDPAPGDAMASPILAVQASSSGPAIGITLNTVVPETAIDVCLWQHQQWECLLHTTPSRFVLGED